MCALGALALVLFALPTGARAQLSASPDPTDFGDVRVGNAPTRNIVLSNAGAVAITVESCAIEDPAGDFAVVSCPGGVAAGGQASATVSFSPQAIGAQSATLTITYDTDQILTVDLAGSGVAPDMVVTVIPAPSGSPIDFGAAEVGAASATTYTFRVTNQGGAVLVASLAEGGANPDDWSYEPAATGFSVAPGASRDIVATFTPGGAGARAATVTFTDADGLSATPSVTFDLSGTGLAPLLEVDPAALAFGTVAVGATSPAQTTTIRNAGDADLTITSVAIPGANSEDYQVSGFGGPTVLGPGEELEISVEFQPLAVGPQDATLVVTSDSPVPPVSASVSLTGSGSGAGVATLSATALSFGAIDVHTGASASRTVTVGNAGNIPLELTAIALENLDGTPFSGTAYDVSVTAPITLAPGADVDIEVVYQPVVEANDYAVLVIETDSPDTPRLEISLAGRGLDRHIEVSLSSIEFPPTYRNPRTPSAVELQVQNTGESPLALSAVMLGGEGAPSFSLAGALPDVIPPLGVATVDVLFAPTVATDDPIRAELLLVNDDDERPMVRIDLSGLGILPAIEASVGRLDFGSAAVGLEVELPDAAPLRLVNRSEEDSFVIQEARAVGPDGELLDSYRVRGLSEPVELAPGDELLVEVVFVPGSPGDHTGTLELLIDEDPLGVPVAALSGQAVEGSLRGSGCAAAGGAGGGAGAILALAALLSLGRARRRARRRAAALFAALAWLAPAPGAAQEEERQTRDLDLTTFRPVHGADPALLTVDSPRVGPAGAFAFDLWLGYAHNPLVVEGREMTDRPIGSRATAELAASYSFGGRFEVTGVLPLLVQSGEEPHFSGVAPAEGGALGDVRLRGKAFLAALAPLSFGLAAELTMPTGADEQFAGAAGPSASIAGLVDCRLGPLLVAFNGGVIMRQRAHLADVEQGHQITYAVAGAYQLGGRASAIAELFGAIDIGGGPAGGKPLEAVLGGRYRITREVAVVGGAGRGILPGIGAPELRLFAAVSFSPMAPPIGTEEERRAQLDLDGDGVSGAADHCADDREDRDGFQDEDGCPDLDDDGDGVPDRQDVCRREAEDFDRFEDRDGCPERDNDSDGVPDETDRCPVDPEDTDGHADGDGCLDPDNDRDGVFDALDRCPAEQETINGNDDDDGCPDRGESLVLVTKDRLELFEPIRFRGNSAVLLRSSTRVLGQIGATLRANREIARLRIRVHVHPRGDGDDELSAARAEAVRRWLVEWGVDPGRLEARGAGSREPLVEGNSARARQVNDRVIFEIAERREVY